MIDERLRSRLPNDSVASEARGPQPFFLHYIRFFSKSSKRRDETTPEEVIHFRLLQTDCRSVILQKVTILTRPVSVVLMRLVIPGSP